MKKKFVPLLLASTLILSFSECKNEKDAQPSKPISPVSMQKDSLSNSTADHQLSALKIKAITKFISISFGVDTANVSYDVTNEEFVMFGKYKYKRAVIEKDYDAANEYKLKYESKLK
jgi:hypothetical protein